MSTQAEWREDYYSRVAPVIGRGLRGRSLAVCNLAAVAGAAERLAGCLALRWVVCDDERLSAEHPLARLVGPHLVGDGAASALARALTGHNGWEDGWDFLACPGSADYAGLMRELRAARADLLLGGGTAEQLIALGCAARELGIPAVLVALFEGDSPHAAVLALLPGDGGERGPAALLRALGGRTPVDPLTGPWPAERWFSWLDANALAAGIARALLLDAPTMPGRSTRELMDQGRTAAVTGRCDWPWTIGYVDPASCPVKAESVSGRQAAWEQLPGGPVLIVGCGSLGSVAARDLCAAGAREIILVDGDVVDPANPVRQFFSTDQVGRNKAAALARNLAGLSSTPDRWTARASPWQGGVCLERDGRRITYFDRMIDAPAAAAGWFATLLDQARPAAALLATGADADYETAAMLRERDIGHVAGRCYPRARYFEALVVDGRRGPCFSCLRGHLYTGPRPGATPEERLRYSRPALAGGGDGEAMPATLVDSGRAADVLARIAWQLALPAPSRAPWLRDLLAAEQTCLIGGNETARASSLSAGGPPDAQEWAYGIALPGQVVAFGRDQVIGTAASRKCHACGRIAETIYKTQ